MRRLFVLFVGLYCFASYGPGGDVGGNGGHGVRCIVDGEETYELLDYYEGRRLSSGFLLDLGDESLSVTDKALHALSRLEGLDESRKSSYEKKVKKFLEPFNLRRIERDLKLTGDTGPYSLGENCELVQIVIRQPTSLPIERYWMDERIWKKLPKNHQAGLILHEVIYEELISLGHRTSEYVRKYNRGVATELFKTMTTQNYFVWASTVFFWIERLEFEKSRFEFSIPSGEESRVHLESLLKEKGNGSLEWELLRGAPAWVSLSADQQYLNVAPPTSSSSEEFELTLAVTDGERHAIAGIVLKLAE